jgi:hypothetical protein
MYIDFWLVEVEGEGRDITGVNTMKWNISPGSLVGL